MKNLKLILLVLVLLGVASTSLLAQKAATVKGPEKGSLFIVGGGGMSEKLVKRFIALAGGNDAPIVVVPTAGGADKYDDRRLQFLKRRGATNVTLLHTYDKKVADTDAFVTHLKNAKGVWFGGGPSMAFS